MRRILFIVALILGGAYGQDPPSQVMDSAVVVLRDNGSGQPTHGCSGAVVALPRGMRIVSAGHCTRDGYRYYARDVRGNVYTLRLEEAVSDLRYGDYAIFRSAAAHLLPALEVGELPRPGDPVFVVSAPLDYGLLFFVGRYAGVFQPPSDHVMEQWRGAMVMDVSGARGSSGAVVVNAGGQAIGILSAQFIVHPGQGALGRGPEQLSGLLALPLPQQQLAETTTGR